MIMIKKIYHKLSMLFNNNFISLEKQARRAGVRMGENNFISSHFWDTEPYLIKIGSNCQITGGVRFATHGGGAAVRDRYPKFDTFGKVEIGDYVYIGFNSLIMPGVTIGNNVIVAAGSVVTKSIPNNSVVAGNPAKYICSIDDYLERNLQFNTDTKGKDADEKRSILMILSDDKFISKSIIER